MKLLLVIYLLTTGSAFSRDLRFGSMESGDRIEITRRSVGCFHNTTSYYEVTKSGVSYTFRQYAIIWDKADPQKIAEKRVVGSLDLTEKEVEGLDGVLKFYRGKKDTYSTTQVALLMEYYEGAKRVGVEKLEDESGGLGLEKRHDVTRFEELAERFSN